MLSLRKTSPFGSFSHSWNIKRFTIEISFYTFCKYFKFTHENLPENPQRKYFFSDWVDVSFSGIKEKKYFMHVRDEHYEILNIKQNKGMAHQQNYLLIMQSFNSEIFLRFRPKQRTKNEGKKQDLIKKNAYGRTFRQIFSLTRSRWSLSIVNFITT